MNLFINVHWAAIENQHECFHDLKAGQVTQESPKDIWVIYLVPRAVLHSAWLHSGLKVRTDQS